MKLDSATLGQWLALETRALLAQTVLINEFDLSVAQANRITARLNELGPAAHELRLAFVRTYTTDLLDPWLAFEAGLRGFNSNVYHAPYGAVLPEAEPGSGLEGHRADVTVLALQREDLHPAFNQPLAALEPAQQDQLRAAALTQLQDIVDRFRARVGGLLVVTLLPVLGEPGLGLFDTHSERSETTWWATLKRDLAQYLRDRVRSSLFLDLDAAVAALGRRHFFDHRLWYAARFPFSAAGAREVARRIVTIGALTKWPKAKVIAVDADNTLWGGVIGEDGISGIALGPDYPGNAYVAFQRRLLEIQQRGFVLALCSKNNEADVLDVLRKHPHQVLKEQHFAARRINWESKPQNLIALAEELNVGLESFVFVDDSDHECAAVRHELPQVEVVQVPSRPVDLVTCLDRVARLEILSVTAEDLRKTEMYAVEHQRRELEREVKERGGSVDQYLRSLQMKMRISFDERQHVARLAQLTQKTNQFNLTTRRYSEQQVQQFIDSAEWTVADFTLQDVFGHSGIVGLAILRHGGEREAVIDSFLMSCRVIGRRAEEAFLETLLRILAERGVTNVVAEYLPTAKNVLIKDFLPQHGFVLTSDGRYRRNLVEAPPKPATDIPIIVEVGGAC